MLSHAHRSSDYFALCVDTYATLTKVNRPALSGKTLIGKDKISDQIFTSLERMDADDRIKAFCRAATDYILRIDEAIRKHAEGFKKQIALLKESVLPLMKVDTIFRNIYGQEVFNQIAANTAITYFPNSKKAFDGGKESSYQLYVIELLSYALSEASIDTIYDYMVKYLNCPEIDAGQLDFPDFGPITTPWKKPSTLAELGYTPEYGINGLNKLVNNGQHVILFSNLSAFLNSIESDKRGALDDIKAIERMDDDLPQRIEKIRGTVRKLEIYSVLLGSLMVITNATAYSAYEAAYKFHVAEIEYNKSQTK